ncbi:MAG: ribosome silencing factor [Myxococcales bacterium]|nr:ribosome silencing factor [Myxococcales bacterium]
MTRPSLTRAALPAQLQRALELAVNAKAQGPVVLQLTEVAGYTDYALIVSGRSDRHVGGITEAILAGLKAEGLTPIGSDGLDEHLWDLLDFDDFLVHVFYHPVRRHYDLESMWNDAPRVELGLPADVMDVSGLEGLLPPDPMPAFRGGSFGAFEGELGEDDEAPAGDAGELAAADDDDYVDDDADAADIDAADDDAADDIDDVDGDYDDELGDDAEDDAPTEDADEAPAPPPRGRK